MTFLDTILGKEEAQKLRTHQAAIMDPDKARMKALFEKEITAALDAADSSDDIVRLTKQFICNEDDKHEFEDAGGGGPLGDRFIERCKNCGFENHV